MNWTDVPAGLRGRVGADGLYTDLRSAPAATPRPALFLDRDGTVIDEVAYISRPDDVRPIPEAVAAIRRANDLDIPVVVVTNQGNIGRGILSWTDYVAVEERVSETLSAAGVRLDAVYAAPHAGTGESPFRKPGPGMFERAARDLGLDLGASWIAGDCATDLAAGRGAGLCRGWLVPTGHGARDAEGARALAAPGFEVVVGETLAAVTQRLERLAGAGA